MIVAYAPPVNNNRARGRQRLRCLTMPVRLTYITDALSIGSEIGRV
jgi:hypothetical protein